MVNGAITTTDASQRQGCLPSSVEETITWPTINQSNLSMDNLNNFRPSANRPFMGKVVEWVVPEQLQAYLEEEENCLNPFRSGFRLCRTTEAAVVELHDGILWEADRGGLTLLVLLDFSAASHNTIDPGILLGNLSEVGIRGLVFS